MICKICKINKQLNYFYKNNKKCKECYIKSQLCIHNNRKSRCKECCGGSICEHNSLKETCKDCGGSQICEHDKQKSNCKECHGSKICEHDKQKSNCKQCGGSQICEHNRLKQYCKECGGSQICEHKRIKSQCKECDGSKICEHKRIKSQCKECDGSKICEHKRIKSHCKDCGGSQICIHDKQKQTCILCSPDIGCKNCKEMIRSQYKTYNPYCFICYCVLNPDIEIKRRYKTKENLLAEALKEMNLGADFIQDKRVQEGCSEKRPDFLFDLFTHTVIVECDENDHKGYNTTCELDKLNATFTDLADRPMILIRFNPDRCKENKKSCFDKEGRLIKIEWERRIKTLEKEVKKAIKEIPEELMTIKYLF